MLALSLPPCWHFYYTNRQRTEPGNMSAFWIFAAIVTAVYAIYYAVIISIDLYGKKDNPDRSSVETFDITDLPSETSKSVEVTDEGFRIGGTSGSDGSPQWNETTLKNNLQPEPPATEQPPKLDASGAPITPAQEKINSTQQEMEEISPDMSSELMTETMLSAFMNGKPPVQVKKTVAKPEDTTDNNEETKANGPGVSRDHI